FSAERVSTSFASILCVRSTRRNCLSFGIVSLPPVVPMPKEALFGHGWTAHDGEIRPGQRPHRRCMPVMNCRLSKVGAMRPFFFHGGFITPRVGIQYKIYITMRAINLRAGESTCAWLYPLLHPR